jgi:hypothetical protein
VQELDRTEIKPYRLGTGLQVSLPQPLELAAAPRLSFISAQMNLYLLLLTLSGWGYTRIRGALHNLGHDVARNTIKNTLLANGLEPAPERGKRTSWRTFIQSHLGAIAGADPNLTPWREATRAPSATCSRARA